MGQCWKRCKLTDAPMSSKGRRPWTCQMCVTNQAEELRALFVYRRKFLARLVSSVIYFVGNIYLFYTYTVLKPLSLNLLGVAVQNMKETSVYQVVRCSWLNSASAALQNRREKEHDNGEKKMYLPNHPTVANTVFESQIVWQGWTTPECGNKYVKGSPWH